jgi:DNA-binding Lrp family transcriptional regulator
MKIRNNQHSPEGRPKPPLENDAILSDNERRILKQLIEKPGLTSYKDIQRSLAEQPGEKMPYETLRDNVDRLEEGGYLEKGWTVDFRKIGYQTLYRIDVMIEPSAIKVDRDERSNIPVKNPQQVLAVEILHLVEKEPFKNWVLIENIEILLGDPADLCITARVAHHRHVFSFVTHGLRSLPGIRQTSTCQIAWSVRYGVTEDEE